MRSSHSIELVHLNKEKEEEKHFGRFFAFWFDTFVMLFYATRGLVGHENTRRWMLCCYKCL